jgi:choline dehydrogenase-like flavoprotein
MASRLSENGGRRVLLLEAGPDYETSDDFPAEIASAGSMAAAFPGHPNNWSFVGELFPGHSYPMARGKIMGGSSATNGTYWIRGSRADFDEWAGLGNELWSYDEVLPFFKKSERDLDFDGEYHGRDGPMPIARPVDEELRPVSRAFTAACLRAGFTSSPDKNVPDGQGVGPIPHNVSEGLRVNTAMAYLSPARHRSNLTVIGGTLVQQVRFDGTRAVGVEAETEGRRIEFESSEVVLCAGGIKSPQLLLLSGIGPAADLRAHGIDVVHDSPGVGKEVRDHPSVFVYYRVPGAAWPATNTQACLNYTAEGSDRAGDMQIICGASSLGAGFKRVSDGAGRRLPSYIVRPWSTMTALGRLPIRFLLAQARRHADFMLYCSLEGEKSNGEITLVTADPADPPEIRLNYLSHPDDLPRLAGAVRLGVELLQSPEFGRLGVEVVAPTPAVATSDESLHSWIRSNLGSSYHTTGSARMGPAADPGAVVDQHCKVRGVEGLRVVDLSIVPNGMRRGTAATAVMIGERAADFFA